MLSQLADFFSLIYPRVCESCHRPLTHKEEFLCLSCELALPKSPFLTNKHELLKKFAFQPKVMAAYAFLDFIKDGMAQRLIHALKYHNKPDLGVWLGTKYGHYLKSSLETTPEVIIPSPLHEKRQHLRGYNQSERLAVGLAAQWDDAQIVNDAVLRVAATASQTRKSKIGRWENVDTVFALRDGSCLKGKHLLIVDDVVTSGATLGRLCDEVAQADPSAITIAALAAGR